MAWCVYHFHRRQSSLISVTCRGSVEFENETWTIFHYGSVLKVEDAKRLYKLLKRTCNFFFDCRVLVAVVDADFWKSLFEMKGTKSRFFRVVFGTGKIPFTWFSGQNISSVGLKNTVKELLDHKGTGQLKIGKIFKDCRKQSSKGYTDSFATLK